MHCFLSKFIFQSIKFLLFEITPLERTGRHASQAMKEFLHFFKYLQVDQTQES